jgi:asparagine synthase (glutamine-hydrolysing)
MCGIWGMIQTGILDYGTLYDAFMKLRGRGPEFSDFKLINDTTLLGFHRLPIMDLSADGNQPFFHVREDGSCVYCVCNGEIYGYEKIKKDYGITTKSHSDCEIIIPLYEKIGVDKMIRLLGSEFAFIILDIDTNGKTKMIVGRDPIGNRPAFYSTENNTICISSELKGMPKFYKKVQVFPPGHYMVYENEKLSFTEYYSYNYEIIKPPSDEYMYTQVRNRLINCVRKRMMTDRQFGLLLSGGLDSSLICGIVIHLIETEFLQLKDQYIDFFTIGFKSGSTDVPYAIEVVDFLKQKHPKIRHTIVEIDEDEALLSIDNTIYTIESFDITSVRASTMQFMIAKYIQKHTNVRVSFVGELSDEIFAGYLYNHYAPNKEECRKDGIRLVKDAHTKDGLRTDRTMADNGLEVRLPFSDPELIDYVFSLPEEYTMPKDGLEKFLLREAFRDQNIIPESVRIRTKNAFSDAVSTKERSWYQVIQEYIETVVSEEEYLREKDKFTHCTPFTKESYYYRKKFVEYFGDSEDIAKLIPYFWMPKWTSETLDPSARTLKVYRE